MEGNKGATRKINSSHKTEEMVMPFQESIGWIRAVFHAESREGSLE
jgi:hypothetical protein